MEQTDFRSRRKDTKMEGDKERGDSISWRNFDIFALLKIIKSFFEIHQNYWKL